MITISLCMIVKNEEVTLAKCLGSILGLVDEIIIVDTGSTDRTKKIAASFTDKIFDFKWVDDFSAARNYSYSKASMDYILWLDADDVLLPEDRMKFKELKSILDASVDNVMMKYNVGFDTHGNVTFSYYRERLSKRSCNFQWREPVHEYLAKGEKVINTEICVTHTKIRRTQSDRNLKIYRKTINRKVMNYLLEAFIITPGSCTRTAGIKMQFCILINSWILKKDGSKIIYAHAVHWPDATAQ